MFDKAQRGRYLTLKALTEQSGNPWTTVAELTIDARKAGVKTPTQPGAALKLQKARLTPGEQQTVYGTGNAPGATLQIYQASTPSLIGTVKADAKGNFTFSYRLQPSIELGKHTIYTMIADSKQASVDFTVYRAQTTPKPEPSASPTDPAKQATSQSVSQHAGSLAQTGSDWILPVTGMSLMTVIAGLAALLLVRRKRARG